MNTDTLNQTDLFKAMDETVLQLQSVISLMDENSINQIPYAGSWTPAMVITHITKSTNAIAKAMQIPAQPAERNIDERIPDLKKIFLDFSKKMQSPDFIEPEAGIYQKQDIMTTLPQAFERLKENAQNKNVGNIINGLPMGEITILELLHFVLYHTQRHMHQLKKIRDALQEK